MLVSQITKPGVQTYQNNSRTESFESEKGSSVSKKNSVKPDSETVHLETAKVAAHIVSKYELRSSTATEMAAMSRELFNADIINLEEYQGLSYRREFHNDYQKRSEHSPAPPLEAPPKRDFIKLWQDNLGVNKENNDLKGIEKAGRILNILENLHTIADRTMN